MRSGSKDGSENERIELSIPPLDLLRLRLFVGDRGVLRDESEDAEFGFDV
jgi:hypothetical protein